MGNCAGASKASTGKSKSAPSGKDLNDLVLKILVEVNFLTSEDGPLRWEPALDSLVPLSIYCIQVGKVHKYRLEATGVDGRSFHTEIVVPGTRLRKSSRNFIQWRDDRRGGAWGLNFMSEIDTDNFLKLFSATMSSGELVHNLSSASLSIHPPDPPMLNKPALEETEPDITIEEEQLPEDPIPEVNDPEVVSDSKLPTSASTEFSGDIGSVKSSEGGFSSDSEQLELYEPSSPFAIKEEFILPDIIEENEDTEIGSLDGQEYLSQDDDLGSLHSSLEDGIIETNFNETSSTLGDDIDGSMDKEKSTVPDLPVSPPPGPLLSPHLNNNISLQPHHGRSIPFTGNFNRHSVGGGLEDIPPPLPATMPPGKLISPRHSMFLDLANISSSVSQSSTSKKELDLSQLMSKINGITNLTTGDDEQKEGGDEPEEGGDSKLAVTAESVRENNLENDDEVLTFVPAIQDEEMEEDSAISRQRLGSYHLKTFEPPKEFSDSGFQDTDSAADRASKKQGTPSKGTLPLSRQIVVTALENQMERSSNVWMQGIDSSTIYTSDDLLTENSGSNGLKTIVSSGSEHSTNRDEDNDGDSVTTRVGEITKSSPDALQPKAPASSSTISIIRKTGWLELNTLLVCKNKKVAMKSKRKWKKYWANLKKSVLFLYECEEQSALPEIETVHSDLKLDLESSLAHAVHDHPKRDHLFCLGTSSGNTYYMQTTSQAEVEDWVMSIHCGAATASTRQPKDQSLPILMNKVEELNKLIEKENQLKNMTFLNRSAAMDTAAVSMASDKLVECSENLETYKVEVYRIRCYIASLQGKELPNPQSLLGSVSKPTKSILRKIGIFSVTSLHAMVSAHHNLHSSTSTSSLQARLKEKSAHVPTPPGQRAKRGSLDISSPLPKLPSIAWGKSTKAKSSSLPAGMKGSVSLRSFEISGPFPKYSPGYNPKKRKLSLEEEDVMVHSCPEGTPKGRRLLDISGPYPISPNSVSGRIMKTNTPLQSDYEERTDDEESFSLPLLNVVMVRIPSIKNDAGRTIHLTLRNDMTSKQLLSALCQKFKLDVSDYFVRLKELTKEGFKCVIPKSTDIIAEQHYTEIEICQKSLKTVQLLAKQEENAFGLTLVPEWDTNTEIDLHTVNIEEVEDGSVAGNMGINKGDEVVLINEKSVMELGWVEVERLMSDQEVALTLRTCSVDAPLSSSYHSSSQIMDSLICPAPLYQPEISQEMLKDLIVPTPNNVGDSSNGSIDLSNDQIDLPNDQIDLLLKDSNEISKLLRTWQLHQTDEEMNVPWTKEDKLRKSISDLIDTEDGYVRHLNVLVERYLEPLRREVYLTQQEVENLIGNIIKVVQVQKQFLFSLKETWNQIVDVSNSESSLKDAVFKVVDIFIKHYDHFKEYSSFCASHQMAKQLLDGENNEALIEFFRVRNPTTNPSLNVDSLLAKPIVRVARYPLFLGAMKDHTAKESEENLQLREVIKGMGLVADHINEMQRLCETYWPLIQTLSNDTKLYEIGVSVRITELEHYGDATWLNPTIEGLSKGWKKGQGPRIFIFIFKSAIILICLEKKHKRKDSKIIHEIRIEAENTKYKTILPTLKCGVSNLPDSDGVTNMWRLQYRKGVTNSDTVTNYLFRSRSAEEKEKAIQVLQDSIQQQHLLYGSNQSVARAMALGGPHSNSSPPTPLAYTTRVASPPPSNLSVSMGGGYWTRASDTDHD